MGYAPGINLRPEQLAVIAWAELQPSPQAIRADTRSAFGELSLYEYRGLQVIIKKQKPPKKERQRDVKLEFYLEASALFNFRHPKIVKILGVVLDQPDYYIVQEFCANYDLMKYYTAQTKNKRLIGSGVKRQLMLDAARGLNYLHRSVPKIMHRDVKSLNMFMEREEIKLGDLGTLRASEGAYQTVKIGSIQWMAPEVIRGQGLYDEKCDVYSFGIVMLEIQDQVPPYVREQKSDGELRWDEAELINQVVELGYRPTFLNKSHQHWIDLAQRCWEDNPRKRPDLDEVIATLEQFTFKDFQQTEQQYIEMRYLNVPYAPHYLSTRYQP